MTTPSKTIHSYEPRKGHGLAHDPIASIVGPRPIGWISSRSEDGQLNLAPYSFFNLFNYKPPIVAFSSVGFKDTIRNVQATREFVVNLATRALAEQVNLSSAAVSSDVNEFDLTGLSPVKSQIVAAPRVGESPVNLECKVLQIQQLAGLDGKPVETWMVTGEVVAVHIDPVDSSAQLSQ
jgi:flavin reductase (DIM6/NTAB) family NADH-FMN oxidoreductase RutF